MQEGGDARSALALGAATPAGRLMGNSNGVVLRFPVGACGLPGDSFGRPEPPRRDPDEPLESGGGRYVPLHLLIPQVQLLRRPFAGTVSNAGEP
jgi:hypothetical protein